MPARTFDYGEEKTLSAAMSKDDPAPLESLLTRGQMERTGGGRGWTAVHMAAHHGKVRILRFLVARGASLEARDMFGHTPLMCAAARGRVKAIAYLLEAGADVTKQNRGATAVDLGQKHTKGAMLLNAAWRARKGIDLASPTGIPAVAATCDFETRFARSNEMLGEMIVSDLIVACDPYLMRSARPFARQIESGRYQGSVSYEADRVSAACLHKKPRANASPWRRVVRWELALRVGDKPDAIHNDHDAGYAVDHGVGCFMTDRQAERFRSNEQLYSDCCRRDFELSMPRRLFTREHAFFIFASGHGDGRYPSYWGLAEDDSVQVLVTDFRPTTAGMPPAR